MPKFAARYLHSLSWLHKPENVIDRPEVMAKASLLLQEQNPHVHLCDLVQGNQSVVAKAAPRDWFLRNFCSWSRSQDWCHEIALAAATAATSTVDLDSLFLSVKQESRDGFRRFVESLRSRRNTPDCVSQADDGPNL